ncbi:hypothetical protein CYMTET_34035 [Cymbomonas tetramitiformis]|uniref:SGNH hydrolase-type esterase domain-containing protein n=1 Tax=Cymbomonas tetramitiformis TaxID=36881 RepID=A0AAE0FC17_9CHLO|nr:hypothetical protein CYMTET_34035 [Cymbomonas tetramitiformis]
MNNPSRTLRSAIVWWLIISFSLLDGARASAGWSALTAKLAAGKPVRILAAGTSVLGTTGGCTEAAAAVRPFCANCCGAGLFGVQHATQPDRGAGWLRHAFNVLNVTYPHRSHALVNVGMPGGTPSRFAGCLKKWVPEPALIDLWVLEFLPVMGDDSAKDLAQVETIVRAAWRSRHGAPPAILFVNFQRLCNFRRFPRALTDQLCGKLRVYQALLIKEQMSARHVTPSNVTPVTQKPLPPPPTAAPFAFREVRWIYRSRSSNERRLERLAKHYGASTFSVREALLPLLKEALPSDARAVSASMSDWTEDGVHPFEPHSRPHGAFSAALLGNLLAEHLQRTLQHSVSEPAPSTTAIPAPRHADASIIIGACYEFWQPYGDGPNVTMAYIRDRLHRLGWGFSGWPPVMKSQGFEYSEVSDDSRTKIKPGFQAQMPGDFIELKLNTLPESEGAGVSTSPFVSIGYLQSYAGMGKARWACLRGCTCQEGELEGLEPSDRVSITQMGGLCSKLLMTGPMRELLCAERGFDYTLYVNGNDRVVEMDE